jgi:hypothetical protein
MSLCRMHRLTLWARLADGRTKPSMRTLPDLCCWCQANAIQRLDEGHAASGPAARAKQVTELDQRSWLAAMGDPAPLAESAAPSCMGSIVVDGRTVELWHGTMRSHSDLSESADTPLAMLVGMPAKSSWPPAAGPFHDVTLDGYFVCWSDVTRRVSLVVYAVAAIRTDQSVPGVRPRHDISDELLGLMKTATVGPAP